MKKYTNILATFITIGLLVLYTFTTGCKKDSDNKDYTSVISDKTWWGEFRYAGDSTEYYSAHFNADHSVVWDQLLGEFPATWSLSDNHLTLDFAPLKVIINADITNDNKFTNIKINTSTTVNSGQLFSNPSQQSLDGTTWKGVYADKIGSTYNITMNFLSGNQVRIGFDGLTPQLYTYTRSPSGVVFTTPRGVSEVWFGIIVSDTEIRGSEHSPENSWVVTKQ